MIDLTDSVKGHRQYWLRIGAGREKLKNTKLEFRTVCQMNVATIPRLKDGDNQISFKISGRALVSAGPNRDQALAHVVAGSFDSPSVTLKLEAPRGERVVALHANSHNISGNPPDSNIAFKIEFSTDGGHSWTPVVDNWKIERRGPEPDNFWSQSFTYGSITMDPVASPVLVRFSNDGGRKYRRVEAHLEYEVSNPEAVEVAFAWTERDDKNIQTATHRFPGKGESNWILKTGSDVETLWIEMK